MAEKKVKTKSSAPRKRRKLAGKSIGLTAAELLTTASPNAIDELQQAIDGDGGRVLAKYREPFGGQWLVLAALPIDLVEPTPYQRNLSDTHMRKLEGVIAKLGRFLDPIIVIRKVSATSATRYWTPNGNHRLSAMKTLGAKCIIGIVIPETSAAYQILALNTEKAHNLRERSLEVIRIYKGLLEEDSSRSEKGFAFYLEESALVTLGLCYERNGKFAGGAYHPILRRLEEFSNDSLRISLKKHESRADKVFDLDTHVTAVVTKLKERGLISPYLRNFVISRINPLRWIQGDLPSLDVVLKTMTERAQKFNTEKIKQQDLANTAGSPDSAE